MSMVHIIGAGCGDYDLITLRGKSTLESSDVIVYDSLIDTRLLELAPDAEKICVGKRAGQHSKSQDRINEILVQKAVEGKTVARLKGGDSFVFGRGGEEIEALKRHNIPHDIVPGISSCIAVPELAGIPVTHRGVSRSFHVITAHTADGAADFAKYAKLSGTLIFLMGLGGIEQLSAELIRGGMREDIPAVVISNGAGANQRIARAELKDIANAAKDLAAPAVIVVGETAAFDFAPRRLSVSVAGTAGFYDKLSAMLNARGICAEIVCDMRIEEINNSEITEAITNIQKYNWLVLTSTNGVDIFIKKMRALKLDIRKLRDIKIAVIGSGTAERLEKYGFFADMVPERFTAAELGRELARKMEQNERALILRARQGSAELTEALGNIEYDDIKTYDVRGEVIKRDINTDYIVFASASGVSAFFEGGGVVGRNTKPVCICGVTAAALKKNGINKYMIADECTAQGIVNKIMEDANETIQTITRE